jgi:hypothetical protein
MGLGLVSASGMEVDARLRASWIESRMISELRLFGPVPSQRE